MRIVADPKAKGLSLMKRCYLPITIYDNCPKCGKEIAKDLSEDYLSYPEIGRPLKVGMYHYEEGDAENGSKDIEHEWDVKVVLSVTLEEA
jgi:hypothetical protein